MDLKCFDQTNALNGLVAVLMIMGGGYLMGGAAPNVGSALLTFGFLILALAITDRDLSAMKDPLRALKSTRSMVALGSAALIVVGRLAVHYHLQQKIAEQGGDNVAKLVAELPTVYSVLINGGLIGLIAALAMNKDGSLNMIRGGLGVLAAGVIYYTTFNMGVAMFSGNPELKQRTQMYNNLSYLLLVLAVAYTC